MMRNLEASLRYKFYQWSDRGDDRQLGEYKREWKCPRKEMRCK